MLKKIFYKPKKNAHEVLSHLLTDVDNKYCADCRSKGPRWASCTLGIFLCVRCAGIHRNMGVHVSRIKSVDYDLWTLQQVATMKGMGNSRGRAVYEANLGDNFRRPQTNSTLDEFIRSKYQYKRYISKEHKVPTPTIEMRKCKTEVIILEESDIVMNNIDDEFGDFVSSAKPVVSNIETSTKQFTVLSSVDDLVDHNVGNSSESSNIPSSNIVASVSTSPAISNNSGKLDKSSIPNYNNNNNVTTFDQVPCHQYIDISAILVPPVISMLQESDGVTNSMDDEFGNFVSATQPAVSNNEISTERFTVSYSGDSSTTVNAMGEILNSSDLSSFDTPAYENNLMLAGFPSQEHVMNQNNFMVPGQMNENNLVDVQWLQFRNNFAFPNHLIMAILKLTQYILVQFVNNILMNSLRPDISELVENPEDSPLNNNLEDHSLVLVPVPESNGAFSIAYTETEPDHSFNIYLENLDSNVLVPVPECIDAFSIAIPETGSDYYLELFCNTEMTQVFSTLF